MKSALLPTFFLMITLLASATARAGGDLPSENCVTRSGPSDKELVAWGMLMGVADYALGVSLHEGSHAVAAKSLGGEIDQIYLFPSWTNGHIRFGYTAWHKPGQCPTSWVINGVSSQGVGPCKFSQSDEAFILAAPKLTDALLMGGYVSLFETGNLPSNKYSKLALTVLATGAWVDFSKDLFTTRSDNDVERFLHDIGANTTGRELAGRAVYGALIIGSGVEVGRGMYSLFKDEPKAVPRNRHDLHLVLSTSSIGLAGKF